MKKDKLLLVIVGPTAVGKTNTCVKVAKAFHTEIIYADSRQFYQELAIGTAKPTLEEMDGVPHHFVDCMSIEKDYNAFHYADDVLEKLEELFQKHDVVILSGGSGMYVDAVCKGMDRMPHPTEEQREETQRLYQEKGLQKLQEELQEKDPEYYEMVDINNPQRVMRALEVMRLSGRKYSSYRTENTVDRPFEILKIGLERDREELYDRINLRMDLMLEGGLLEEVAAVKKYKDKNALQTVGYKEILDYWDGKHDWEQAVHLLKRNSRRYAKKQMTWFKRDSSTHWFHPDQVQEMVDLTTSTLQKIKEDRND